MTRTQLASFIIRLITAYFIISYIADFPVSMYYAITNPQAFTLHGQWIYPAGMAVAILLAIAVYALANLKSNEIAKLLVLDDDTPVKIKRMSTSDIASLAFSCVGLLCIVWAVPGIGQHITGLFIKILQNEQDTPVDLTYNLSWLVAKVLQMCVGVVIILRVKGLVKVWHSIRDESSTGI